MGAGAEEGVRGRGEGGRREEGHREGGAGRGGRRGVRGGGCDLKEGNSWRGE